MQFLTVLLASSIINFQQPVQSSSNEHIVDTDSIEQTATDYLKTRFSDADFIQTAGVKKLNDTDFQVYVVFSAESTPVDTCVIHMNKIQTKTRVEHITCVNYQKKIGFRENVYTTIIQ
ncbi:MAG: hypothetical protein P8Y24_03455 [Gammaproteobacteria bacterium]|jgi:hypothetical protein